MMIIFHCHDLKICWRQSTIRFWTPLPMLNGCCISSLSHPLFHSFTDVELLCICVELECEQQPFVNRTGSVSLISDVRVFQFHTKCSIEPHSSHCQKPYCSQWTPCICSRCKLSLFSWSSVYYLFDLLFLYVSWNPLGHLASLFPHAFPYIILLAWDINAIVRLFSHFLGSPILGSGI